MWTLLAASETYNPNRNLSLYGARLAKDVLLTHKWSFGVQGPAECEPIDGRAPSCTSLHVTTVPCAHLIQKHNPQCRTQIEFDACVRVPASEDVHDGQAI